MKYLVFSIISIIIITLSCTSSNNADFAASAVCNGATPTYTGEIATILNNSCATSGCHNASSASSGINLSTYTTASSQFRNNSNNLASIHHASGVKSMPRGSAMLSEAIINKLDCWVKGGTPE